MKNSTDRHSAFTGIFPAVGESADKAAKGDEINKVINGIPVTLRFSDTADERATDIAREIMLNSFSKKYQTMA